MRHRKVKNLELCIEELTRDLHNSDCEAKWFTTEYEDKFHGRGKNINYVKFSYPKETEKKTGTDDFTRK